MPILLRWFGSSAPACYFSAVGPFSAYSNARSEMEQWTIYLPAAAAALVALAGYLIARASAKRFRRRLEVRKTAAGETEIQVIHDEIERAQSSITHSLQEALAMLEKAKSEVRHRETAGSI